MLSATPTTVAPTTVAVTAATTTATTTAAAAAAAVTYDIQAHKASQIMTLKGD